MAIPYWPKLRQFLSSKKGRPSFILIPVMILVVFAFVGAFAPWIAPHPATETNLGVRYQPPFWYEEGDWSYPLGTDAMGRDILSRLLIGARASLTFSLLAIGFAGIVGTLLGLIAGYYGSRIETVIMRLVDLTLSIPVILLAMTLVVIWGPSLTNLILIVGFLFWPLYTRLARAETLSIKKMDFIAAAKISGCSSPGIIARHVFPNVVNSLVVLATLQVANVILLEAALSFLGIGIPRPAPAWGTMIADGRLVLSIAWWVSTFPGLAMAAVVLSLNLCGDWLRDRLDPKLRQV